MKTSASHPVAEQSAVTAPLHIVLTYDHPAMATAARKMLAGFLTQWAPDTDIHRDEWSFAELEHPKFSAEALELAAVADFFVIAVTGVNDLPQPFTEWMNDWITSRAQRETAVVLAIGSPTATAGDLPLCASVLALPRANGLSFFATTLNLEQTIVAAAVKPQSLLARLGTICTECLPESSGLND